MDGKRKHKIPISTEKRRRGRPRGFDTDAALQAATDTFLRKGYAAATLDDLSAAMGINRPSLYAAFEGKDALYQRSLRLYAGHMEALFCEALSEAEFKKALRRLYAVAIDAYFSDDGEAVGCMVACTAVTEAVSNEALRHDTKSIMDEIDRLVARRIEQAIEDGELPRSVKAKSLSRIAVGVLHTLALRARAGTSQKVLDEIAVEAVGLMTRDC